MTTSPLILFSNSSTRTWEECPRKYFLSQLKLGTGIAKPYPEDDLLYGQVQHELMPELWVGDTSRLNAKRAELEAQLLSDPQWEAKDKDGADRGDQFREAKAKEWGRLLVGGSLAASRHILPMLAKRYRVVKTEETAIRWIERNRVGLMAKQDTLLQEIENPDNHVYAEWKTSASLKKDWHKQWRNNPQTWTGAMTAMAEYHIKIDYFFVVGILKGTELESGFRSSPLLWAYRQNTVGKRETKADGTSIIDANGTKWSYVGTTAKGWERTSTDEFPGGVEAWVKALPLSVIQQQTCITEMVPVDLELAEEWLSNQRPLIQATMELHAAGPTGEASVLARYFPRILSRCESGTYNKSCAFKDVCHNPLVQANPLSYGYIKRVSHHQRETELREGGADA